MVWNKGIDNRKQYTCKKCNNTFLSYTNRIFCGKKCYVLSLKGRKNTWGNKISNSLIGKAKENIIKEKISNTLKKLHSEKIITPWNKNKKGLQTPWNKDKRGLQKAWNKDLTKDKDARLKTISEAVKTFYIVYPNKRKEKSLKMMGNKNWANKKGPTCFEHKIIILCSKYRLPFVYTGDGRILIGYKNPDFINEENKIIIEVFLDYFKIRDYGSIEEYMYQRGKHFSKYGYKTIFISEKEITNKNWEYICLNKINNKLKGGNKKWQQDDK